MTESLRFPFEDALAEALNRLLADWLEYLDIEEAWQGPSGYTAALDAEEILKKRERGLASVPSASPPKADERGVR